MRATKARGLKPYGHPRIPRERRHTALYIFQLDGDIFRKGVLFIYFIRSVREAHGATPKWRLNSPYILRPRGRVKLCISVGLPSRPGPKGGTYLRGISLRSYTYVPAARPENRCSWRECLAVASFASVNHGLNKIAYPRESNEMSALGPPPSPRPGPNCSLAGSIVPSFLSSALSLHRYAR